ncbi:MAG: replication-relaxation family protein [Tepidisphaeraceae bacterium]|jgi:hypothetical protein
MAFRLTDGDLAIVRTVAEHRILTIQQLSLRCDRNAVVMHRRIQQMEDAGLIRAAKSVFGRKRGQPEKLISLAREGIRILRDRNILGLKVSDAWVVAEAIPCVDHQLLTNWFWLQSAQVPRIAPQLTTAFLSPMSPFLGHDQENQPMIFDRAPAEKPDGKPVGFTPDGVLCINHAAQQKTVLFFLEVDMGNQTLASPGGAYPDIRQKILNYQGYFRSLGYKRYEQVWNCHFRGFRLLFLADTAQRRSALCRLVRGMQPADFIWLADQDQLLHQGLWARIWARGGQEDIPAESILGSQMPQPCPSPALSA